MNLKQTRKSKNLTMSALAKMACLTVVTICNIENEYHLASPATKKRIESVLGSGIEWKSNNNK